MRDALRARRPARQVFVATLTSVYGAMKEVETGQIQSAPVIAIESLRITHAAVVFGDFLYFQGLENDGPARHDHRHGRAGHVTSLSIDYRNHDAHVIGSPGESANMADLMRGYTSDRSQRR